MVARRGPAPPLLEPVEYLRTLCFEPARRSGTFLSPEADRAWEPLDDTTRARFNVTDPDTPAFGLRDAAAGRSMVLKLETIEQPGRLPEKRCTLVVIGGRDHDRFASQIAKLMRASGTQRHVGAQGGMPCLAGWLQRLWTGMPSRGSKQWVGVTGTRQAGGGDTWIVVTNPSYWDRYDYIAIDLKTRQRTDRPVSVLTFSWTSHR